MSVLWTLDAMAAAMHAERAGPLPMDLAEFPSTAAR